MTDINTYLKNLIYFLRYIIYINVKYNILLMEVKMSGIRELKLIDNFTIFIDDDDDLLI